MKPIYIVPDVDQIALDVDGQHIICPADPAARQDWLLHEVVRLWRDRQRLWDELDAVTRERDEARGIATQVVAYLIRYTGDDHCSHTDGRPPVDGCDCMSCWGASIVRSARTTMRRWKEPTP